MKPLFALGVTAVLLTGCGPVSLYYREGVDVSQMRRDETACAVAALRDAPVANQIRRRPPIFIPGERVCNAAGTCVQRPGYWVAGDIYTVDVNAGLRARVQDMCMAQAGYRPVSIRRCPDAVRRAAPPRITERLPGLTDATCVIVYDDDAWQIVNPVRPVSSE